MVDCIIRRWVPIRARRSNSAMLPFCATGSQHNNEIVTNGVRHALAGPLTEAEHIGPAAAVCDFSRSSRFHPTESHEALLPHLL